MKKETTGDNPFFYDGGNDDDESFIFDAYKGKSRKLSPEENTYQRLLFYEKIIGLFVLIFGLLMITKYMSLWWGI